MARGQQIVLTAPFTEMIDHAGYFIQMGMASIPIWMEWVMDKKYPEWRNVTRFEDGSAKRAPAGLRVVEKVMVGEFGRENVVVCYPDDLDQFIGEDTRIVAVSTHNPMTVKTRAELLGSIKPNYWKYLREDTGDLPGMDAPPAAPAAESELATA